MWVKWVSESTTIRAKQFHACDSSEIVTKTETVQVQASMHVNDSKCLKKSSKQHSHKRKHKKRQKCCKRQVETTYPWIAKLDVSKSPGCVVGCKRSNIDVKKCALKRRINKFEAHDAHATNIGKSDTWRKDSETIFACNLQLLKIAP